MNNPTLSGAVESAAPVAALPTSITPTPGVQETPAAPAADLQIVASTPAAAPTVVIAKPVGLPLASLPKTLGLPDRQRIALQALAAGNRIEDAARIAGVSLSTLFRWRKHHPRFIAAWNTWRTESERTARNLLSAANEHAARNVLHAIQTGDLRASLSLLKEHGLLKPEKIGSEYHRIVRGNLRNGGDTEKLLMGGTSHETRRENVRRRAKEKEQEAAAPQRRIWDERYWKIPALPRPVTADAVAQAVKTGPKEPTTCAGNCSITITAVPGDRKRLIALAAEFDGSTADQIARQLDKLPKLLTHLVVADHAEELAQQFEALGAKVELRPGWPI